MTGPVDLVIVTRIQDGGAQRYTAWQVQLGEELQGHPGFLCQQIVTPTPPAQVDWIVVQKFSSVEAAKSWLASEKLALALDEVRHLFVGTDDIYLRSDTSATASQVTALISCRVDQEHEAGFLAWEREMFQATAKAPGFIGQRLDRPVPGILDRWVITLTFDTDENLTGWLESPRRAALLERGEGFQRDMKIRKGDYGFGFWYRNPDNAPTPAMVIFKSNLVVLLVLYPIVFLWDYFIGGPYLLKNGMPFWLALFIGNFVSTQITGWWAVPKAFGWFHRWLSPTASTAETVRGFVILTLLCGLSMGLYAFLLARH